MKRYSMIHVANALPLPSPPNIYLIYRGNEHDAEGWKVVLKENCHTVLASKRKLRSLGSRHIDRRLSVVPDWYQ
jgi:hypothetical protein